MSRSSVDGSEEVSTRLRSAVRGPVFTPGEPGWAERSMPWSMTEQRVLAVTEVADADDMATAVRCARDCGAAVTAQPVGNGASPALEGTVLLRTGALDAVEVDPDTRTARVGAGVGWQRLLEAASPYGLTGLVGSSTHPSVTGFCLGGGLSWFGRAHGLACNSVRSFEVVTSDGERRHVDAETDPELFWALRGGAAISPWSPAWTSRWFPPSRSTAAGWPGRFSTQPGRSRPSGRSPQPRPRS